MNEWNIDNGGGKQSLKVIAEKGDIFKYLSQNIETFLETVGEMKPSLVTLGRFYMWKEEI